MTDTMVSQTAVGAVANLTGQAQAVSESGTRDLSIGSEIFQGDTIVTEQSSNLEISFLDDTRFSQGENSRSTINAYVYDPEDASGSDFLLEMTTGVFRTVTGEIAKQNPDNFKLKSPMALIGIRGTVVNAEIQEAFEKLGVETIGQGHVLVVQDSQGNIQFISDPLQIIEILQGQPLQPSRPMTRQELRNFQEAAPNTVDMDPGRQAELKARVDAAEAEAVAEEAAQAAAQAEADAAAADQAEADAEAALAAAEASGDAQAIADAETALAVAEAEAAQAAQELADADADAAEAKSEADAKIQAIESLAPPEPEGYEPSGEEGNTGNTGNTQTNTLSVIGLIEVGSEGELSFFQAQEAVVPDDPDPEPDPVDPDPVDPDPVDPDPVDPDPVDPDPVDPDPVDPDPVDPDPVDPDPVDPDPVDPDPVDPDPVDPDPVDPDPVDPDPVPLAVADSVSTPEDTPVTIDVLDNDADEAILTIVAVSDGEMGHVTINTYANNVTYTPDDDANGFDTFTYTVRDSNGVEDTVSVSVTITPVPDALMANDDSTFTQPGTPVIIDVLGNDTGDDLSIESESVPEGVNWSIDGNTIVYTPGPESLGDSFDYVVKDGYGATATATVSVDVNNYTYLSLNEDGGFGNSLERGDDNFSDAIDIRSVFTNGLTIFGESYNSLYVNTNGSISFGEGVSEYTPEDLSSEDSYLPVMIAPFWEDVDIRDETPESPKTPGGNSMGTNLVYYDLDTANKTFTATWDDVGYYPDQTQSLNAFQVQLVDAQNGDFDIIFRYEDINWVDDGNAARAGVTAWDGINYLEIDPSGDASGMLGLEDAQGTSEYLGYWEFQVRNGTDGDDNLVGGSGNDFLFGGLGDDSLDGGVGSNILDGGGDFDVASYEDSVDAITVTMNSPISVVHGSDQDTLENIEYIQGSDNVDIYTGDGRDMIFEGGDGADIIDGGDQNGMNMGVSYYHLPIDGESGQGVDIDLGRLSSGFIGFDDGYGNQDLLKNIQGIVGSQGADTLTGESGVDNWFNGQDGADEIDGGAMTSAHHANEASYSHSSGDIGVVGDLFYDYITDSFSGSQVLDSSLKIDHLTNITRLQGSDYNDSLSVTLSGPSNDSSTSYFLDWGLYGGDGEDTLTGTEYEIVFANYYDDPEGVSVNLTTGLAEDGWGKIDTLKYINGVVGSVYDDTITGNAFDNILDGEGGDDFFEASYGNDTYNGGSGSDHVSYDDLDDASFIGLDIDFSGAQSLVTGYDTLSNVHFTDTLTNIESVTGSMYADSIIGGNSGQYFYGADGDDAMTGANATDYLYGEQGNDSLFGNNGNDSLSGGDGNDTISGGLGDDTILGGAGDDILMGGTGNDTFGFTDSGYSDLITDFQVTDGSNPVDTLQFVEPSLGFFSKGTSPSLFGTSDSSDNPTLFKIIGINETGAQANADWTDVALVINNAIDVSLDLINDSGTYFILNNGTGVDDGDTGVFYWEGDTIDSENDAVDAGELHMLAELTGVSLDDISAMTENNFEVDMGFT